MEIIVIISTGLQFAAGFLALRLVSETEKSWAWMLLSAGILAMAFRRTHSLIEIYQAGFVPSFTFELLGLAISVLIFAGVYLIAPMLRNMRTAQIQLAESEERYRTVADFTYGWEYWQGPDGNFIYVSPSCEGITGYKAEEFLSDPQLFLKIIHPEFRERVERDVSTVAKLLTPSSFDARIVDKGGKTHWIAHNSLPVHSREGVFLGIRGSIRTIDHRKALEADLKESRAVYESLVQHSPCLVLRLTPDGTVTFANRCAEETFGLHNGEIVGRSVDGLFVPLDEDGDATARMLRESLLSGRRADFEHEHQRPDGARFWGEWVNSAVLNETGKPREFVCVGIDVTRRKALDKLKDDVSRIIRHDLKSPLAGIIGIPSVLQKDPNITPRQAELLQAVEEAGTMMLDLINRSLDLYKLETGTYRLEFAELDLMPLNLDVVRHVGVGGTKKTPVEVTLNGRPAMDSDSAWIFGERPLIFSMLGNLIRNAVEASADRPVTIDVTTGDQCLVAIHNAGVVPEAIRGSFFDKYVTAGKFGGTGLGTYSAKLIAEKHGGTIAMTTSAKTGTTPPVTLPTRR